MTKNEKTNAARICETIGITFVMTPYETGDGLLDGVSVADKIGKPHESVFKTLVTVGSSGTYHVFMIPVEESLNLKKAAKAVQEKAVHMIPVKDILKVTGYVKGGCSPIGMKRNYQTVVDEMIDLSEEITFSAGKIGLQLTMSVEDFRRVLDFEIDDIID